MASSLDKLKHQIEKNARKEDKALADLQRYFERNSKRPARTIKLTTQLNLGGHAERLAEYNIDLNEVNEIVKSQAVNRALRHNHNIDWNDIEDSYRMREYLHNIIAAKYIAKGKYVKDEDGGKYSLYGGRSLFQQGPLTETVDDAGRKIIKGAGSRFLKNSSPNGDIAVKGWKFKYDKLDIDIQKEVLDEFYSQLWKATDKHLLDKFNSIDLGDGDFNKLIKVTDELAYDIWNVKGWKKEVEKLVKSATVKYKAQLVKEYKRQIKEQQKQQSREYILTIDELETIGRAILGRAIELCPIETGRLRKSGRLYVSSDDIRIIFECEYAAFVHDNVNAQHAVGTDHFLTKAAQEMLPNIPVFTEVTGKDGMVYGEYMGQTWDKDINGNIVSDMYWREHKGYFAVYMDIDRNLKINYAHYK